MESLLLTLLELLLAFAFVSIVAIVLYFFFKSVLKIAFEWTWRDTFTVVVAVSSGILASDGTEVLANLIAKQNTSFEQVTKTVVNSIEKSEERILEDIQSVFEALDRHAGRNDSFRHEMRERLREIHVKIAHRDTIDSLFVELDKHLDRHLKRLEKRE